MSLIKKVFNEYTEVVQLESVTLSSQMDLCIFGLKEPINELETNEQLIRVIKAKTDSRFYIIEPVDESYGYPKTVSYGNCSICGTQEHCIKTHTVTIHFITEPHITTQSTGMLCKNCRETILDWIEANISESQYQDQMVSNLI